MLIHSLRLDNFLSFGSHSAEIPLHDLNIIIGPNGSGKSNLLEAFELLRSTPRDLLTPIRDGGGVLDWLWKGTTATPTATIDAVIENQPSHPTLRYALSFTAIAQRFEITSEKIENKETYPGHNEPYFYYRYRDGDGILNIKDIERRLQHEDIEPTASILSQRKDPDQYPELTYLGNVFGKIRLYREWSFGRYTPPRLPQKPDLPNNFLEADARNLGLVLNRLRREPGIKSCVIEALQSLYEGIDDYDVQIEGGTVQVFLHEGSRAIPATRLSDGTLRYLCLLAILCHPSPPPLVCIEEPELGLHPDVLPSLAELMKKASQRCQLVVTTHSDILVDAMTDQPESILVCERGPEGTMLHRLSRDELQPWLQDYRLGELWTRGDIGGTRW